MIELIQIADSSAQIAAAAASLRRAVVETGFNLQSVLEVFETWAARLGAGGLDPIPGVAFLRLWLRRGTLEPILTRELGSAALQGGWTPDGRAQLKPFPLGVVGHWPAGNIEIQPLLSMTCALLGGNAALVRIPSGLEEITRRLLQPLAESDPGRSVLNRLHFVVFEHTRQDLLQAMAESVDGAMIWGGKEAVLNVRSLPFPHWARLAVFGPRISVAAMDAETWTNPQQQASWCQRIARDVWQFDQQACSSPQVLFLEKRTAESMEGFVSALQRAFDAENRAHPRLAIHAAMTSAICQARASWLLDDTARRAVFPEGPDWTLLVGRGAELPQLTQGKTLTVLEVDSLFDPVAKFDGNVQTLGLGMADMEKEVRLAELAAQRGVDRIVKLGRMHVFIPPWDGADLIRPMVRMVRHIASKE